MRADRGGHQVAPGDLGHDGDVGLQPEQSGDGLPDQVLVVGQQNPDHGWVTRTGFSAEGAGARAGVALAVGARP